jgi:2-keto-myo-inositol isomerase
MIGYGLNGATTMPAEQAREIQLAAAAGFDLIEFRAPKLEKFFQSAEPAELSQLLRENRLTPLSINALEQINTRPDRTLQQLVAECERVARWAEAVSCPFIIAVPGRLRAPQPEREIVARTRDSLTALVETTAARGVGLGFEFLGFEDCSVNSLRLALKILDKLDHPQLGLVIDTFHFFLSGDPLELIAEIRPGKLFVFHVNDAENLPRRELLDEHRLLPGEGVIPLRTIWDALRKRELVDHVSLELFRPEYWKRPPEGFLADARARLAQIFS